MTPLAPRSIVEKPLKRSLTLRGHRTSVTLEPAFWSALKELARKHDQSLNAFVAALDERRAREDPNVSLASVLRVRLLVAAQQGEL
ncbi:MAG: ribbon-helix-helix domain-containing protein [Pseudomonadota bacterium]